MNSKLLFLFRGFFPSWKFFEEAGPVPELFFRTNRNETWEPWMLCLPKQKRNLAMILFNPLGNFHHACDTLLQQLKNDSEQMTATELENSVPFQLVKNLVFTRLDSQACELFQFKVVGILPGQPDFPPEDLIISPIFGIVK